MTTKASSTADREIVISRLINAPQALVFEVWTDPTHVEKWYGPNGFTITNHEMNVQPGGVWRSTMHGMGMDFPSKIEYLEVVKPERLVYTHGSGMENDPGQFHVTITFEKQGLKTLLTMHSVFKTAEMRNKVVNEFKAIEGGNQTMDRFEKQLAEIIAGKELVITRVLNAPRELVYKAWTEAERLAQWWGPKGFTFKVAQLDFREGGSFLYSMNNNGFEMWGKFVYHEIVPPERIVFVNSFSDKDGNLTRAPFSATWPLEVRNTLTLTEKDGKTALVLRGGPINATTEEQATFEAGRASMEQGFGGTFEQLDEYLKTAK